jgi:hypothetical protein
MDHESQAKVDPLIELIETILAECGDRATSPQEAQQFQYALLTRLRERVLGEENLYHPLNCLKHDHPRRQDTGHNLTDNENKDRELNKIESFFVGGTAAPSTKVLGFI